MRARVGRGGVWGDVVFRSYVDYALGYGVNLHLTAYLG